MLLTSKILKISFDRGNRSLSFFHFPFLWQFWGKRFVKTNFCPIKLFHLKLKFQRYCIRPLSYIWILQTLIGYFAETSKLWQRDEKASVADRLTDMKVEIVMLITICIFRLCLTLMLSNLVIQEFFIVIQIMGSE